MQTRASSNRFVPCVTKSFLEILAEQNPPPAARAGAAIRRLGAFLARSLSAAARAVCASALRLADALRVSSSRIKARAASAFDAVVKPLDYFINNLIKFLPNSYSIMAKKNLTSIIPAGLLGASSLFLPNKTKGDLIDIFLYENNAEIDGSTMTLRNMEGGELGYDDYDNWFWPPRPPGSPPVWLRVYSDQYRIHYNYPDAPPLWIDARPYSGPDANKPFPLRADVQGLEEGQTISANNCYFVFEAQNGYGTNGGYRDEGLRDIYSWMLTLDPTYAQFTDGTHSKSGSFDLRQGPRHETPRFNIYNVPGNTSFLEFNLLPIPEPSTAIIMLCGAA